MRLEYSKCIKYFTINTVPMRVSLNRNLFVVFKKGDKAIRINLIYICSINIALIRLIITSSYQLGLSTKDRVTYMYINKILKLRMFILSSAVIEVSCRMTQD